MNEKQALNIITNTFEKKFDKDNYKKFLTELLNSYDRSKAFPQPLSVQRTRQSFINYIQSFERIGRYTSGDDVIDLLIVYLKDNSSIEKARSMQRNFVAGYLKGDYGTKSKKDAALVAFVSPDKDDWRFSLVKMDYKIGKTPNGKIKVREEFTPARRWSFLVGKNESSHTAQSRFVPLIADDSHKPTLAELEEAFNIEKVTKEFFEKYRDLFLRTKAELDRILKDDPVIKNDFEQKGINTVDFTKKLLGQIVFLYFLQKKGWFGVGRNAEWGTGSKKFLRELFEKKHGEYNNFFNDILEPLFYEALRIDRSHDDHYYSRFDCKIPFLNGGLFDPINGYDWVKTNINIDDKLFSNSNKTKEGDKGDGILDIFDRYNFTVKEDEPLEKEVAIDPELLGKTYEEFNAIRPDNYEEFKKALKSGNKGEESINKQYGVYYTPREIVHYMCQQSLIEYLSTELPTIPKKDIETLIHYGEHVSENEAHVEKLGKETDTYSYKLPDSIRTNAEKIDEKLATIKVCDPAVGSGAFPVGMMTEIVKVRNVLSAYIEGKDRSVYRFKRECIENSLYGVDIDPGAVEIAKLRLWLSLIVDEEDIKQIKPLPNLDYKIVCGNSLLCVEPDLFNNELFKELEKIKHLYFNETNPTKKQEYKKQIDELISKITNGHTEFDFEVYFSEVFHLNGGFDVVIGNPPYVQLQKDGGRLARLYEKSGYETFDRMGDIYALFYEKGIKLLKENGLLCFITSNKWMRAGYGRALRKFFLKYNPVKLIDCGPGIFESATVDVNILIIQKRSNQNQLLGTTLTSEAKEKNIASFVKAHEQIIQNLTEDAWFIGSNAEQKLKEKIERIGKPLKDWDVKIYRGILTGLNEAFIIDSKKREEILANCKDEEERKQTEAIIKPILRGRDIKRYHYEWVGLWVIFIPWHLPLHEDLSIQGSSEKAEKEFQKQYPTVYQHLLQFKDSLSKRNKEETGIRYEWYALQRCAATYYPEFEKEKVVWQRITQEPTFCLVKPNVFVLDSMAFFTGNNLKFIMAVLNSKVIYEYVNMIVHQYGFTGFRLSNQYVEIMPIPPITSSNEPIVRQIEALVDNILVAKRQNPHTDTSEWENEIDKLVYRLYELTEEEVKIIEGGR